MNDLLFTLAAAWLGATAAPDAHAVGVRYPDAAAHWSGDVDITVVDPGGRSYDLYPHVATSASGGARDGAYRAWVEARPGAAYGLHVRNRTGHRVGVVIAVDGRNVITGERSTLARHERMYVLEPWASATYRGWRTGRDRVNEFYFTQEGRSYAAAFDDHSAMGLISAAVYRDAAPPRHRSPSVQPFGKGAPGADGGQQRKGGEAGTGFGEERWSPSRTVRFEPARHASGVILIRYAWRDTLCEYGITACGRDNRLWDREWSAWQPQYAPPPPGYARRYRPW